MATQRQQARCLRAWQRFSVKERAQQDASYRMRKAVEQASLERSLGIPSSPVLLAVLQEAA